MTSFERQIRAYARKIRLRAIERRELRERVLSYMEYHPAVERPIAEESQSFSYIHLRGWFVRPALGALAICLVVGVSYAAEYAVPGDILYPVKVRVNEEVRSQLSRSAYDKVVWETERVERRIAEARFLAKEGKLTPETAAVLSENVRAYTEAAQQSIEELRESDADEAVIAQLTFESALDVQSAMLATDDARALSTSEEGNSVRGIAEVVNLARTELSDREVQTRIQSPISYEIFMSRIEIERNRAKTLFAAIEDTVSEEERAEIEERLTDIDTKISAVQDARNATTTATTSTTTNDSISELRSIFSKLQKLIVFMTDIDVRASVDLDTLIPEELSDTEEQLAIELALGNLVQAHGVILERLEQSEDPELQESVSEGLTEFDTLLETAAAALEEGRIEDARAHADAAAALMGDLMILTDSLVTMPEIETGTSTATTTDEQATTTEGGE